jgi:hypothetical protein
MTYLGPHFEETAEFGDGKPADANALRYFRLVRRG